MTWDHEAVDGIEITQPTPRYQLTKAFTRARAALDPNKRAAIEELIERYRKAGDERPVALTVRQLADARKMTRMDAHRALAALVAMGFIVVFGDKGKFEAKRKPTRYRLTMFPCNGAEATNDFVEDPREWKRAKRRNRADAPLPATVSMRVDIPLERLVDFQDAVKPIFETAA